MVFKKKISSLATISRIPYFTFFKIETAKQRPSRSSDRRSTQRSRVACNDGSRSSCWQSRGPRVAWTPPGTREHPSTRSVSVPGVIGAIGTCFRTAWSRAAASTSREYRYSLRGCFDAVPSALCVSIPVTLACLDIQYTLNAHLELRSAHFVPQPRPLLSVSWFVAGGSFPFHFVRFVGFSSCYVSFSLLFVFGRYIRVFIEETC